MHPSNATQKKTCIYIPVSLRSMRNVLQTYQFWRSLIKYYSESLFIDYFSGFLCGRSEGSHIINRSPYRGLTLKLRRTTGHIVRFCSDEIGITFSVFATITTLGIGRFSSICCFLHRKDAVFIPLGGGIFFGVGGSLGWDIQCSLAHIWTSRESKEL